MKNVNLIKMTKSLFDTYCALTKRNIFCKIFFIFLKKVLININNLDLYSEEMLRKYNNINLYSEEMLESYIK
jgi:hypothetical protein